MKQVMAFIRMASLVLYIFLLLQILSEGKELL